MRLTSKLLLGVLLAIAFATRAAAQDPGAAERLGARLDAILKIIQGKTPEFTIEVSGSIAGLAESAKLRVGQAGERGFFLDLDGPRDAKGALLRTPEKLTFDVPAKNTCFVASGELPAGAEALQPASLLRAAAALHPIAQTLWPAVEKSDGPSLAAALSLLLDVSDGDKDAGGDAVRIRKGALQIDLRFGESGETWEISVRQGPEQVARLDMAIRGTCALPEPPSGRTIVAVDRAEMERSLQRGAARAIDLKRDDLASVPPPDGVTKIPGARLEAKDGQRTCWLTGSNYEMGLRHGRLLQAEIRKMLDSTLYVVGWAYTVAKGRWFLADMRDAWKRLEPHCDAAYLDELRGLADGAKLDVEEVRLGNMFPELFHCSGFAVAGDSTVGGKLYHGRVLDYMVEIGLQNAQVDFVTRAPGGKGFVNVGYAGFIGCVTGMNEAQVSIGEMGGRGEGRWDGTPMAFLMRRALEKAATLEEAQEIFRSAKRTCEYYYVIADGKSRSAVGVAAWPDRIEFIRPGEAHAELPHPVPGCVLLSGGDRYELLSKRARDAFGKIDEAGALELMSRPVAMNSNLHNVLFVPEDGVYLVAHASLQGHKPAASQKYIRHNLRDDLKILDETAAEK